MKKALVLSSLVLLVCATSAFGDCILTNVTEVVPSLHVGQTVHFNFEFVGGAEPYHFALVDGQLPPGVNLTGSGGLRGKVKSAGTGSFDAFVQVTDAANCSLTVAYNIQVE